MAQKLLFLSIFILQVVVALYSFTDYPIEDVAIHAQIVDPVLRSHLYPLTYEPVADVTLTYPILFHHIARLVAFLGFSAIVAVRIIGSLAFIIFPFIMYLVGSLFSRKTAFYALISSAVIGNLTILLVFSAFPQILALDFLCLFYFFTFKKRSLLAGLFLGLTLLTHSFTGIFAGISCLILILIYRDRSSMITAGIGLLVASPWLYQYSMLISNILLAQWHNTIWYDLEPGFISMQNFSSYLIRLNILLLLLSVFALGYKDKKKRFFSALYLICLFFTVYHFTPSQLKFLDTFTCFVPLFAAMSMEKITQKKVKFVLFILIILSLAFPFWVVHDYNARLSVITSDEIDAALWLKGYDPAMSRIIMSRSPQSEVLFASLAGKMPMDAKISDIEVYSGSYQEQIEDTKRIIDGEYSLMKKYSIKYFIRDDCDTLEEIYRKGIVAVCRT